MPCPTLWSALRPALILGLAAQLACLPAIKEQCPLITNPAPAPVLPRDLAQLDALLIRRATEMVEASRGLHRFQVWWFRVGFAEQFLPDLCGRLERARALATAGRIAEAGRKYQALLVASQVMQFAIAMHAMAQSAEIAGEPGGEITQTLDLFADQMAPILESALSEDPRRIEHAITEHPDVFRSWAEHLSEWPSKIEDATERVKVAKLVWDTAFLVVATYEAAGAAAEIAASGSPPMPPLAAFGIEGGAAAAGFSGVASVELAEAIRRLVASGALDAAVVAILSHTLGPGPSPGAPLFPSGLQMSSTPQPAGGDSASKAPATGDVAQKGKRSFSKEDRAAGLTKAKDAQGIPRCEYCGKELEPKAGKPNSYEADHRTPYSKGGPTSPENLAPSCRTCNRSKGAQTPEEWSP